MSEITTTATREVAILAGGCFWCLEAVFDLIDGVDQVESGYTGGTVPDPTYEAVCDGITGHAEAVRVTFDPARIGYVDLLEIFFAIHDPTTLNRQGADVGTQYRSAIFYTSPAQQAAAEQAIAALNASGELPGPVVTEVATAGPFYRAEPYHDDFYTKNSYDPYCQLIIGPKVAKVQQRFSRQVRSSER